MSVIRMLRGKCSSRHQRFRTYCLLARHHDGDCRFGWIDIAGLSVNLDAPPPVFATGGWIAPPRLDEDSVPAFLSEGGCTYYVPGTGKKSGL